MTANAGPRLFDSDFQYGIRPLRYQKTCQKKNSTAVVVSLDSSKKQTVHPYLILQHLSYTFVGVQAPILRVKSATRGWKNTPEELMKAPRVQPFIYYISNINLENIYNKSAPHNKKIVVIV